MASKGKLRIKVVCLSKERLINLLWNKGIDVSSIETVDKFTMKVTIAIMDYSGFKKCCDEMKGKYKIISGDNTYKVLHKFKNRKILIIFPFLLLTILYYLSSHIWTIKIATQEHLAPLEIRCILDELGIKKGTKKKDLDVYKVQQQLIDNNSNISWAKARVDGSVLNIEITEKQNPPKVVEEGEKEAVVATKDGKIVRAFSISGTCIVKTGDMVKKGQILIDSYEGKEGEEYDVGAKGEVYAQTNYELVKEVKLKEKEKVYTGKESSDIYIKIGNKKLYLKKTVNNYKNYDKIESKSGFYSKVTYKEYEEKEKELDEKVVVDRTVKELIDSIKVNLDKNVKILEDETIKDVNRLKDKVQIRVVLICEENIAAPAK